MHDYFGPSILLYAKDNEIFHTCVHPRISLRPSSGLIQETLNKKQILG